MMSVYVSLPAALHLDKPTIARALRDYEARHGAMPTAAVLHPRNSPLAPVLEAAGIPVTFLGGCLLWELRLGTGGATAPPVAPQGSTTPGDGLQKALKQHNATGRPPSDVRDVGIFATPPSTARTGRGRPQRDVPRARVEELQGQGVPLRRIAQVLGVSKDTLYRRLASLRQAGVW